MTRYYNSGDPMARDRWGRDWNHREHHPYAARWRIFGWAVTIAWVLLAVGCVVGSMVRG